MKILSFIFFNIIHPQYWHKMICNGHFVMSSVDSLNNGSNQNQQKSNDMKVLLQVSVSLTQYT